MRETSLIRAVSDHSRPQSTIKCASFPIRFPQGHTVFRVCVFTCDGNCFMLRCRCPSHASPPNKIHSAKTTSSQHSQALPNSDYAFEVRFLMFSLRLMIAPMYHNFDNIPYWYIFFYHSQNVDTSLENVALDAYV